MIAQLDVVDGKVRQGTLDTLRTLALTSQQAQKILEKIYRQLLRDEIVPNQFSCISQCLQRNLAVPFFLERFTPLVKCSVWRTRSQFSWAIRNNTNEKSTTGYAGLYNLACICYMNSLLQQLYMIPSFREQILQTVDPSDIQPQENLLYQLQCLMLALKLTEKQYHNPRKFCASFKDLEGTPVNVYEQMDVDEFFNLLMERLEDQMKSDLIKNTFRGTIAN
jgi:ubiquitin carboxyl-terminal hydrolase 9/24